MEHVLLSGLGDDDRRALLARMRRRTFRRHETLFHEGDIGDALHLIDRGRVAIRASTSLGDVATLAVLGPGQSFGEQALIDPSARRTASAVALERVETHVLLASDFDEIRREYPSIDRLLTELLAADVRRLTGRLVEALYDPADQRVLRRLAELTAMYESDGDVIQIPLRQEDLASLAGTTRSTANRVVRQLEQDGLVALQRGRIDVVDASALRALVAR